MAENPAQWGEATRAINKIITEDNKQRAIDAANGDFRCGLSLAMRIANELERRGLLKPEQVWLSSSSQPSPSIDEILAMPEGRDRNRLAIDAWQDASEADKRRILQAIFDVHE